MNNRVVSDIAGREAEQMQIATFLEAVPAGARGLIIRGEPGIGKTTLWRAAVDRARRAGFAVLVTLPAEEELTLALAGLVDLFEHEAPAAASLEAEGDPLARGRTVLTTLRRVADRGPALVAIDDLQWLDSASARALRYGLRRLDAEPLGVIATTRRG